MVEEVYLVRHGQTEWSLSGQHTGMTDIPLNENGKAETQRLRSILAEVSFSLVLTSPLRRARETCELVGFGGRAESDLDLREWNYGDYEGLTATQILEKRPGWMIFRDGCPGGETAAQVGERADRIIARVRRAIGNVVLFGHGQLFRVLVARWLGLPPVGGQHFFLDTATWSVLDYHGSPEVKIWNARSRGRE
jgi:probable phosphoglycerate mutase